MKSKINKSKLLMPKLSKKQENQIDSLYRDYGFNPHHYDHQWYYAVTGIFSAKYMPNWLFHAEIEPFLNDKKLARAWKDKSYYNLWFSGYSFPEVLVRNINGLFLDINYNIISRKEANEYIKCEKRIAVKPSLETGGGQNVRLFENIENTDNIFKIYKKNYIVQKVFRQHPVIAKFNESSVNVVRIVSLLLDEMVHITTAALRVGPPGAFNDNYIDESGGGMLTIGIESDGKLKAHAYSACGQKYEKCLNGSNFRGTVIPAYQEMISIAKHLHPRLAHFRMISWDFTIDLDGKPVIMEYNIASQGIVYYQYVNGPLFGDLTERVLQFAASGKKARNIFA